MAIGKKSIRKIPRCPLCGQKRSVGATNSFFANAVRRAYFCTTCMVEFNANGTLYPPIKEDLSDGSLKRSS